MAIAISQGKSPGKESIANYCYIDPDVTTETLSLPGRIRGGVRNLVLKFKAG